MEWSDWSIGRMAVPTFAFDGYDAPTVLTLADPQKREDIVGEFAAEMVERMRRFEALYEERGLGL